MNPQLELDNRKICIPWFLILQGKTAVVPGEAKKSSGLETIEGSGPKVSVSLSFSSPLSSSSSKITNNFVCFMYNF